MCVKLDKNLSNASDSLLIPPSGKHAWFALLTTLGFFEGKWMNDVKFFWFQAFAKGYLSALKTDRLLNSKSVLQKMLCKGE